MVETLVQIISVMVVLIAVVASLGWSISISERKKLAAFFDPKEEEVRRTQHTLEDMYQVYTDPKTIQSRQGGAALVRQAWLRGIRLYDVDYEVLTNQGGREPDGVVYPDSKAVVVTFRVVFPEQPPQGDCTLSFHMVSPDRTANKTFSQTLSPSAERTPRLEFRIPANNFLQQPGDWQTALTLDETKHSFCHAVIPVPECKRLHEDLVVENLCIMATVGDTCETTTHVPSGADAVVLEAKLMPEVRPVIKLAGVEVYARLTHIEDKTSVATRLESLTALNGALHVQIPVEHVLRAPGSWEIELLAKTHVLAKHPIRVLTPDMFAMEATISSFQLLGVGHDGDEFVVDQILFLARTRCIIPRISLETHAPSGHVEHELRCEVHLDGNLLRAQSLRTAFIEKSFALDFEAIQLPEISQELDRFELKCTVELNGQMLVEKWVQVRHQAPLSRGATALLLHSGSPKAPTNMSDAADSPRKGLAHE